MVVVTSNNNNDNEISWLINIYELNNRPYFDGLTQNTLLSVTD